ncbi:MAG TPA: hypothetical protein VM143_09775 [Acidimicrobiales bacterium]|nr:hypothetical protein [Acidimicrobiales bacterium]
MGTCERCKGTTTEVPTKVGGQELVLHRCSFCDTTQWRRDDELIDLREVLDLTAEAHPKSRRHKVEDDSESLP